jgi:hypothetical protein
MDSRDRRLPRTSSQQASCSTPLKREAFGSKSTSPHWHALPTNNAAWIMDDA